MTATVTRKEPLRMVFVDRLTELADSNRGAMATLRRNAGLSISESRGALGIFYRLLPADIGYDEELYFLVATLYPLNKKMAAKGNLGDALASFKKLKGNESLDRRMTILLDAELERSGAGRPLPGELGFRLRQTVKLLASADIGVPWHGLLRDLLQWTHPDKWVQKQWARAYFGAAAFKTDQNE